jgi:cation-dependent mannose-6-phosphate receptor
MLLRTLTSERSQRLTTLLDRSQNSELVLRGKKLVLNYTGGSPCDEGHPRTRRAALDHNVETIRGRKVVDDDDDDDDDRDDHPKKPTKQTTRRKSAIISLLCDKEPLAPKAPKASVAFIGTMDHCTFFFEARSPAACAGAETSSQGALGPGGVFGVM